jgi:glutathione S-transferase
MLLEEIGADYDLVLVDKKAGAQKAPDYLKLNPTGRIPVLLDNGKAVFESAAIMLHLVDQHPQAGMAPLPGTPERAQFYQWLVFLTNSLQEAQMLWFYPERLVGDDEVAARRVKQSAEDRIGGYLDIIENHLQAKGPYFLGKNASAVDLYFTMLARWARGMDHPPRGRPGLARLLDLTTSRSAVRRAYEQEGITSDIA